MRNPGLVPRARGTLLTMFPRAMWRFLTPYVVLAFLITGVTAFVYADGAPAWVVYLGGIVALLVVLAPYAVWEDRHR
jgi:hypothetical protein